MAFFFPAFLFPAVGSKEIERGEMQAKVAKEQDSFSLFISVFYLFFISVFISLMLYCHRITESLQLKKISKIIKLLQRCFVFLKGMKQILMASLLMPLSSSPALDKMTLSTSLQALQTESNTPWQSFGSAADTCHAEHGLGKQAKLA